MDRLTFKERTRFHDKGLMIDIALYVACGLKTNAQPAHRSQHMPVEDDIFGSHIACHAGVLAYHEPNTLDVSLNLAVDAQFSLGDYVAGDRKVGSDEGH